MNRAVEEVFRTAYHVGERYGRFRILLVGEYGSKFSASRQENVAAFRKHLHGDYVQWILDAFDAAAAELKLSTGQIDRAEFFAYYNYYWCNTRREEIPSGAEIDPKTYLTRLADELGAGLILSAGGVGDERFRREYVFGDDELAERPIFVDAISNRQKLADIFKAYLLTCRSDIDEIFDRLAEQIADGKSPLDVFDNICNNAGVKFNTYPMGKPSGLRPDLLVVCEDPMNLAEPFGFFHPRFRDWHAEGAFNYIDWWCHETQGRFPTRRVKMLTDKWLTEAYNRYEKLFRRFAKAGVDFDFRLYTPGAKPAKINLPF